jgi:endoglucanase
MERNISGWRRRGYGWAIWDYDGPFGFVESGRPDAEYIEVMGRKVDRKMLELLRAK